jgi:hypothetical protein
VTQMCHAQKSGESNDSPGKHTGKDGKQYPAKKVQQLPDPIQPECDGCITDAERWNNSASNIFADIISMRAYWDREFGNNWRKFDQASTTVTLAKQAIEAFAILAKTFRS